MQKCPFNSKKPHSIQLPSVPVSIGPDIPFVPKGFDGVKHQMGGVHFDSKDYSNKYQHRAPHPQNTNTPCSTTKKIEFGMPVNRIIYSEDQNMVGEIRSLVGTDGPLYSRERYDGKGVNGNADWVRGNQFSVNYDQEKVEDRIKYSFKAPQLEEERKTYVGNDPYYPIPDRCKWNNFWYKTYPRTDIQSYTEGGFPKWKYPYKTTQPKTRTPVSIIENYTDSSVTNDLIFYSVLLVFASSFYYCVNK